MQIPISKSGSPDKLAWHFNAKGQYTVKSGYQQVILKTNTPSSKEELTTNPSSVLKKKIWKIQAQPKVKLFLWTVILNSATTMENLFKRNCSPFPLCLIYNEQIYYSSMLGLNPSWD
ncbi:reverse transcriptase [Tanacetum coccineum]